MFVVRVVCVCGTCVCDCFVPCTPPTSQTTSLLTPTPFPHHTAPHLSYLLHTTPPHLSSQLGRLQSAVAKRDIELAESRDMLVNKERELTTALQRATEQEEQLDALAKELQDTRDALRELQGQLGDKDRTVAEEVCVWGECGEGSVCIWVGVWGGGVGWGKVGVCVCEHVFM